MITIYHVTSCFDRDSRTVAYFTDVRDANAVVAEGNAPGSMSEFSKHELVVYESLEDYRQNNPDAVRQRALSKLTAEERKALGL